MSIRSRLAGLFYGPTVALLDTVLRDLIAEVLDTRALVRRAEVDAINDRIESFRRDLTERRSELAALRQSLEALALSDDDFGDALDLSGGEEAVEAARADLARRLERAQGALAAVGSQLTGLDDRLAALRAEADKAQQLASAALATSEAAADGISALESRLAAR